MAMTRRELIQFMDELVDLASEENKQRAIYIKEKFISNFRTIREYEKEVQTEITELPPYYIAAMPDLIQEEIKAKVIVALTECGECTPENVERAMSSKIYDLDDLIDIKEYVRRMEEEQQYNFQIAEGTNIKDILKIKMRDKSNPEFKGIPLKNYFEKKTSGDYTRSSIHGVKGETYDAVLIYVKSKTGKTLTPKFLMEGDLEDELMRIAYVAMTRPRRLLMIAIPENKKLKEYKRFPVDKWDYEYI